MTFEHLECGVAALEHCKKIKFRIYQTVTSTKCVTHVFEMVNPSMEEVHNILDQLNGLYLEGHVRNTSLFSSLRKRNPADIKDRGHRLNQCIARYSTCPTDFSILYV